MRERERERKREREREREREKERERKREREREVRQCKNPLEHPIRDLLQQFLLNTEHQVSRVSGNTHPLITFSR